MKLLAAALSIAIILVAVVSVTVAQAQMDDSPPPPSGITAVNGPNPGEVSLLWNAAAGANYYRVGWIADADYRTARDSGAPWLERFGFVDVESKTAYTITRLTPGTDYWFIVASNSERYGPPQWPQNWVSLRLNDDQSSCPTASPTPVASITPAPAGDYDADNDGLIDVSNLSQLDAMRHDLDGDGSTTHPDYAAAFPNARTGMGCPSAVCTGYELTSNLDFDTNGSGQPDAGDAYWNGNWGWTPIGERADGYRFNTTFDGGGYSISNLYISWRDTDHIGLFRSIGPDSAVRNVRLISSNVFGNYNVGALVGHNYGGTITNSLSTGKVVGNAGRVGGLVGFNGNGGTIASSGSTSRVTGNGRAGGLVGAADDDTAIIDSYATGIVTSSDNEAGGLVAYIGNNVAITASYATGSVSGGSHAGGLAARIGSNSAITGSYATGSVSGGNNGHAGGLVGSSGSDSTITASYATGDVSAPSGCGGPSNGGLVGNNSGTISDSYAIGNVSGSSYSYSRRRSSCHRYVGGLLGTNYGMVRYSYWDPEATGQTSSAAGVSKTTRELQSPTSAIGIYGNWDPGWWDFGMSRQYPVLKYRGLDVAAQRP